MFRLIKAIVSSFPLILCDLGIRDWHIPRPDWSADCRRCGFIPTCPIDNCGLFLRSSGKLECKKCFDRMIGVRSKHSEKHCDVWRCEEGACNKK